MLFEFTIIVNDTHWVDDSRVNTYYAELFFLLILLV
jgi:hypothetical protein